MTPSRIMFLLGVIVASLLAGSLPTVQPQHSSHKQPSATAQLNVLRIKGARHDLFEHPSTENGAGEKNLMGWICNARSAVDDNQYQHSLDATGIPAD